MSRVVRSRANEKGEVLEPGTLARSPPSHHRRRRLCACAPCQPPVRTQRRTAHQPKTPRRRSRRTIAPRAAAERPQSVQMERVANCDEDHLALVLLRTQDGGSRNEHGIGASVDRNRAGADALRQASHSVEDERSRPTRRCLPLECLPCVVAWRCCPYLEGIQAVHGVLLAVRHEDPHILLRRVEVLPPVEGAHLQRGRRVLLPGVLRFAVQDVGQAHAAHERPRWLRTLGRSRRSTDRADEQLVAAD
eukprot:scaffold3685_cov242-Pinguiococcus_pyrenoidosus.AAC.4